MSLLAIFAASWPLHHAAGALTPLASWLAAGMGAEIAWMAIGVATRRLRNARGLPPSTETAKRLGPYTLETKIGEGGMGVVYKASHALLRRPAAIKVLAADRTSEQDLVRFEREVQLTSMLTHPNTIAIYDFGRAAEGSFYYAMEYVDGDTLETLVEREGPQDPARVAHILAQLAGALVEAHGAGLVHRDVKPANAMLCERGGVADVVKVLDFGLTKDLRRRDDAMQSDVQRIVGTPLYMSPEALTDPETVGPQSDLYALGAVGYFLLTGAPPFSGHTLVEVCAHHLHSVPVPPSKRVGSPIPRRLEALILGCLAKSPEKRPTSAAALQKALLPLAAAWTPERAVESQARPHASPCGDCFTRDAA
jgi:serine/threonine-protein kinase